MSEAGPCDCGWPYANFKRADGSAACMVCADRSKGWGAKREHSLLPDGTPYITYSWGMKLPTGEGGDV